MIFRDLAQAPCAKRRKRTLAPLAQGSLCQRSESRTKAPLAQDSLCQMTESRTKCSLAQGPVPNAKTSLA